MMDRRSPPEPVWTPEARTAPVARSLIVTAAPPTASPNTIARFPTTRTITVVGIPGGGASAAQAATRPNKRLIANRKSTRLNSSHSQISYAVFCLKKKKKKEINRHGTESLTTPAVRQHA